MNLLLIKQSSLLSDGIIELLNRHFKRGKIRQIHEVEDVKTKEYCLSFDEIIFDISLLNEIEPFIDDLKAKGKKLIAWVGSLDDSNLKTAFELGLSGYLYYDINEQMLIEAIQTIQSDVRFIHPLLANRLLEMFSKSQSDLEHPPLDRLIYREWEVLRLLTKGYNNSQISESLYLSENTVKNYVSSILSKLDVPNRTNAALLAIKENWVLV